MTVYFFSPFSPLPTSPPTLTVGGGTTLTFCLRPWSSAHLDSDLLGLCPVTRWGGCCGRYPPRPQLGGPSFVAFPPSSPCPKGRRRPADWTLFCQLSEWEVCQSGCRAVRFSHWVSWNPAPVLRLSCNTERGGGGGRVRCPAAVAQLVQSYRRCAIGAIWTATERSEELSGVVHKPKPVYKLCDTELRTIPTQIRCCL